MNKVSDQIIIDTMQQKYQELCKQYEPKHILGVFVTGLANYGFAETEADIHISAIYLPHFEELCTGIHFKDGSLYDVRIIYNIIQTHEFLPFEMLFSKYVYINPMYQSIYTEYFENNKQHIARYYEYGRIEKALERTQIAIQNNDLFEIERLHIGALLYMSQQDCDKCFHPDGLYENYLQNIKDGHVRIKIDDILKDYDKWLNESSKTIDLEVDKIIKHGVVALMDTSLHASVNKVDFTEQLTKTEILAWNALCDKLENNETTVIVSKMCAETAISRPVWDSLLKKIARFNMGTVTNQGVKGTYIKIFGQV